MPLIGASGPATRPLRNLVSVAFQIPDQALVFVFSFLLNEVFALNRNAGFSLRHARFPAQLGMLGGCVGQYGW